MRELFQRRESLVLENIKLTKRLGYETGPFEFTMFVELNMYKYGWQTKVEDRIIPILQSSLFSRFGSVVTGFSHVAVPTSDEDFYDENRLSVTLVLEGVLNEDLFSATLNNGSNPKKALEFYDDFVRSSIIRFNSFSTATDVLHQQLNAFALFYFSLFDAIACSLHANGITSVVVGEGVKDKKMSEFHNVKFYISSVNHRFEYGTLTGNGSADEGFVHFSVKSGLDVLYDDEENSYSVYDNGMAQEVGARFKFDVDKMNLDLPRW